METKICTRCNKEKRLIDNFYKKRKSSEFYRSHCKSCCISETKDNPKWITGTIRRQMAIKNNDVKMLSSIRESNNKSKRKMWRLNPEVREAKRIYKENYKNFFPEKVRAHWTVYNHIRLGNLKRLPCEVCGENRVHAHHRDYSKPLEVIWLCSIHHSEEHTKLKMA